MEKQNLKQFISALAPWLFIAVLVMVIYGPFDCKENRKSENAIDKSAVSNHAAPNPFPEKRPAVVHEKKSLSVSKQKKEHLFLSIIHQAAERHCVDPNLVKAIIMAESGYNPKAVSKKGARGLMQLMPTTAEALGVKDSFDPKHNINAGVEYFKQMLNQFDGNVKLALAAYNAGSRKVRQYQGVPPYRATQYYVKKVFKYYNYYKDQMKEDPGKTQT